MAAELPGHPPDVRSWFAANAEGRERGRAVPNPKWYGKGLLGLDRARWWLANNFNVTADRDRDLMSTSRDLSSCCLAARPAD